MCIEGDKIMYKKDILEFYEITEKRANKLVNRLDSALENGELATEMEVMQKIIDIVKTNEEAVFLTAGMIKNLIRRRLVQL